MQEEFHGNGIAWGQAGAQRKLLYGWGTINASVWLPGLSELVGYTGEEHSDAGTYFSAMQGLNVSASYHSQEQGGSQWAYPKALNTAGGGALLWKLCGQEECWLRTPDCGQNHAVLSLQSQDGIRYVSVVTASRAVHPAGKLDRIKEKGGIGLLW